MNEFAQHSILFLLVLAVVAAGVALEAPAAVLAPLAQGLGVALPTMLGAHGIAMGVEAFKGRDGPK